MNDLTIGFAFDVFEDCLAYATDNGIFNKQLSESYSQHCFLVAYCAEAIASKIPELDTQTAYCVGLLHDIGKSIFPEDKNHFHGIEGYHHLKSAGWDIAANVCLAHTFLEKDFVIEEYLGYGKKNLIKAKKMLSNIEENDYIRLIRLSDTLVNIYRHGTIKERMVYLKSKYKINTKNLRSRYKRAMRLKLYFDKKCGCNIYDLLGVK